MRGLASPSEELVFEVDQAEMRKGGMHGEYPRT